MEEQIPNLNPQAVVNGIVPKTTNRVLLILLAVLVLGLGIFSGYFVAGRGRPAVAPGGTGVIPKDKIAKGSEFGLKDASTFKDSATGVLEAGGLENEGTHKLVREGGPSQTVYLNSSTLDLDQFVGRTIQIWGETNRAQKAGWLMDVGRVKILE